MDLIIGVRWVGGRIKRFPRRRNIAYLYLCDQGVTVRRQRKISFRDKRRAICFYREVLAIDNRPERVPAAIPKVAVSRIVRKDQFIKRTSRTRDRRHLALMFQFLPLVSINGGVNVGSPIANIKSLYTCCFPSQEFHRTVP